MLNLRQPFSNVNINGLFDYALTQGSDAALRLLAEQQHAGESGRRRLRPAGTRVHVRQQPLHVPRARGRADRPADLHQHAHDDDVDGLRDHISATEAPTIIVQDAFTSGGAQQAGPRARPESDARVGRGLRPRHPFLARRRPDVCATGIAPISTTTILGPTYSAAWRRTRRARLCSTRAASAIPTLDFFHARIGTYFQDDIRVKKGLTLSPGVRYSYQTRVADRGGLRAARGHHVGADQERQHDAARERRDFPWMARSRHLVADRPLRRRASARRHHHQSVISGPGIRRRRAAGEHLPVGDYKLNKNVRYSAGVDQRFSPRASVNVLFNYYHQDQLPRGMNLNPLDQWRAARSGVCQHHLDGH